jgi:hypothetical protein
MYGCPCQIGPGASYTFQQCRSQNAARPRSAHTDRQTDGPTHLLRGGFRRRVSAGSSGRESGVVERRRRRHGGPVLEAVGLLPARHSRRNRMGPGCEPMEGAGSGTSWLGWRTGGRTYRQTEREAETPPARHASRVRIDRPDGQPGGCAAGQASRARVTEEEADGWTDRQTDGQTAAHAQRVKNQTVDRQMGRQADGWTDVPRRRVEEWEPRARQAPVGREASRRAEV